MARWRWKKKDDGPQRCFAEDLRDRTVEEYNEERARHRRFFEAYHGIYAAPAMYKILCNFCGSPVELTQNVNGVSGPVTKKQVICLSCRQSDYILT